jgi:hypothetical protein
MKDFAGTSVKNTELFYCKLIFIYFWIETDTFTSSTEGVIGQQWYVVRFCGQSVKTSGIYEGMKVLYCNTFTKPKKIFQPV